ncbi:unnamed protein product [Choristocarpus tenellus]
MAPLAALLCFLVVVMSQLMQTSGFAVATGRTRTLKWTGSRTISPSAHWGKRVKSLAQQRVSGALCMQFDREERQKKTMRLREETEAPFRKVRLFGFTSFAVSASLGLLIAITRFIALTQGIDQGQSYEELSTNIAVDLAAILGCLFLVRNDLNAQKSRLLRMEIGAKLAGLKVRLQTQDDVATVTLADLRRDRGRDKRVAVLAGGLEAVRTSLDSALPYAGALQTSDIVIVPLVLESPLVESNVTGAKTGEMLRAAGGENDIASAVGQAHVALPVALNRWQDYINSEVETALGQGIDVVGDGFSLVIKKNGRIGARSKGCPPWETLVGDVQRRKAAGMDTTNI